MNKLQEELSAAVALTALGVPSITTQLRPQVSLDMLEIQHRIDMNKRANFQRSLAAAVTLQLQGTNAITPKPPAFINAPKRNFAQKLFDVLETDLHSDIIRWLPGGRAFIVLDKRRFADEILPHYFKESQYTSFTRKLSRWKFTRVSRGPYMGAYYHKNFRSDNRSLCKHMSCNNSKLNNTKEDEKHLVDEDPEKVINDALKNNENGGTTTTIGLINEPDQDYAIQETYAISRSPAAVNVRSKTPVKLINDDMMKHVKTLESNMNNTKQNILLIKKQLMEIRIRKAQVEEKKKILAMQEAEATRLRNAAVNLSIQHAESKIIAAAARALDRSNHCSRQQGRHHCQEQRTPFYHAGYPQIPCLSSSRYQDMSLAGNAIAFKRMQQLLNGNAVHHLRGNHKSAKPTRSSRAFAA